MPFIRFMRIMAVLLIPVCGYSGTVLGQSSGNPPAQQKGSGGILTTPTIINQQPQQPQQPTQPLQPWQEKQQLIVAPSRPQTYGQQLEAQKNLEQRRQEGYRMDATTGRLY